MCPPVRYNVYTGSRGKLIKDAPGGLCDIMCRQYVATLSSYRPIWQLEQELCRMAELRLRLNQISPSCVHQMRVDGIVAIVPQKDKQRLL